MPGMQDHELYRRILGIEETKIAILLGTFCDVPRPLGVRSEELGMLCSGGTYVVLIGLDRANIGQCC